MGADFRYRRLGYVALNVTDLDRSTAFLTDVFGLDHVEDGAGGERFFRVGTSHHDVVLAQADKPAFVRSAWELETEDDVDVAFAYFEKIGVSPSWVGDNEIGSLRLERAFRFREPINGVEHEYFSDMTQISAPLQNRLTSFQGGTHFGLCVPDAKAVSDYMCENMGFLVSDYLEGWAVSLMRAFPNPNHHSFAPVGLPTGQLGYHHMAFMVNSIDDIGKLLNRIKKFDVKIQFGIGRHPTSGSIHLYVYDEDFLVWEYTLGMEQFPEIGARKARRMAMSPGNYDLWGAMPDMEYAGRQPMVLTA
jgi:2,3-dihydroxy-p-cumate/2,3-dihydroxybenzoate 3,4-dioxygenase